MSTVNVFDAIDALLNHAADGQPPDKRTPDEMRRLVTRFSEIARTEGDYAAYLALFEVLI